MTERKVVLTREQIRDWKVTLRDKFADADADADGSCSAELSALCDLALSSLAQAERVERLEALADKMDSALEDSQGILDLAISDSDLDQEGMVTAQKEENQRMIDAFSLYWKDKAALTPPAAEEA